MGEIILFKADCYESGTRTFSICDNGPTLPVGHRPGKFFARKAQKHSGTYHPEKIVYTGATVGGVHTGGIHKEEAYVSVKSSENGNGYIAHYDPANSSSEVLHIRSIILPERLLNEAKKNPILANLIEGDEILLTKPLTSGQLAVMKHAVTGGYNAYSQIELANIHSDNCIPYDCCVEVADFLNRVMAGEFHPEFSEVFNRLNEYKKKKDEQNTLFGCLFLLGVVLFMVVTVAICAITA